jgi:hypothetical protein
LPSVDPNGALELSGLVGQFNENFVLGNTVFDSLGDEFSYGKDLSDVYVLSPNRPSQVDIRLDGLSANVGLYLYDRDRNEIASSTDSGNLSKRISAPVLAGASFLEVRLEDDNRTDYQLSITDTGTFLDSDGREELATIISPGEIANDRIGFTELYGDDLADYYKFSIEESSRARITLRDLSENAQLELFNRSGNRRIAVPSAITGTEDRVIERIFHPKTEYLIKVSRSAQLATEYTLEISDLEDIDGTFEDAGRLIPDLNRGSIGVKDKYDYYQIQFNDAFDANGKLRWSFSNDGFGIGITFDQLPVSAQVSLYDPSRTLVDSFETDIFGDSQRADNSLRNLSPSAGTHFLEIKALEDVGKSDYSFQYSPIAPASYYSTPQAAREWSLNEVIQGEVGSSIFPAAIIDDKDFYRFKVTEPSDIGVVVFSRAPVDVAFYSAFVDEATGNYNLGESLGKVVTEKIGNEIVGQDENGQDRYEDIYANTIVGAFNASEEYFLEIGSLSARAKYTIQTSFQVDSDGLDVRGELPKEKRLIPDSVIENNDFIIFYDRIGYQLDFSPAGEEEKFYRDFSDLYEFVISDKEARTMIFTLSNLQERAEVILYQAPLTGDVENIKDLKRVSRESFDPAFSETFEFEFKGNEGQYWLRVQPLSNMGTPYKLTASFQVEPPKRKKSANEKIGGFFSDVFGVVAKPFEIAVGAAKYVISTVGDAVEFVADKIGDGLEWSLDTIGLSGLGDFANTALDWSGAATNWVLSQSSDKLEAFILREIEYLKDLPSNISRSVEDLFSPNLWDNFGKWLGSNAINAFEIYRPLGSELTPQFIETFFDGLKFNSRSLSDRELKMAKSVFGDSINYDLVRVDNWSFLNLVNGRRPFVSLNTINTWGEIEDKILIHELVHVWQYQNDGLIYALESLAAQNSEAGYDYSFPGWQSERSIFNFNREQQASIVEDYFFLKEQESKGIKSAEFNIGDYAKFVAEMSTLSASQLANSQNAYATYSSEVSRFSSLDSLHQSFLVYNSSDLVTGVESSDLLVGEVEGSTAMSSANQSTDVNSQAVWNNELISKNSLIQGSDEFLSAEQDTAIDLSFDNRVGFLVGEKNIPGETNFIFSKQDEITYFNSQSAPAIEIL